MSRRRLATFALFALAACGGGPSTTAPAPADGAILDVRTGEPMAREALVQRLREADFVLLGEVHDNAEQHRLRAGLIDAARSRKPAIVFEQFPWGRDSVLQATPTAPIEDWLDRAGFDRKGWQWPLHQPLVDAAVRDGLPRYGSQLDRERLRPILRSGFAEAPAPLRELVAEVPLSDAGTRALEQTLVEGHCGELPDDMVPMMRMAQEIRDAAMTEALLRAAGDGRPAWLIAGNGHVRHDYGVPRFLAKLRPDRRVVSVGFLEREPDGSPPGADDRSVYDVVWVTSRAVREDPCLAFRKQ